MYCCGAPVHPPRGRIECLSLVLDLDRLIVPTCETFPPKFDLVSGLCWTCSSMPKDALSPSDSSFLWVVVVVVGPASRHAAASIRNHKRPEHVIPPSGRFGPEMFKEREGERQWPQSGMGGPPQLLFLLEPLCRAPLHLARPSQLVIVDRQTDRSEEGGRSGRCSVWREALRPGLPPTDRRGPVQGDVSAALRRSPARSSSPLLLGSPLLSRSVARPSPRVEPMQPHSRWCTNLGAKRGALAMVKNVAAFRSFTVATDLPL